MAMQYATAQGLSIPTYASTDSKTPTTPTTPVVTIGKDGAALAAAAGVVTVIANYGVHVALTAEDMEAASIALKVTSDNCDPVALSLVTEADYNTLRANRIDAAISSRSTYAGGDTAGTTTLLTRVTAGRAANLDNLDAKVSDTNTVAPLSAEQTQAAAELALGEYDAATADDVAAVGAGNGVNTVTVTVGTAGGVVFEGVRVAVNNQTETGSPLVQYTNSNGQCVFYLAAGAWRVIAAASVGQSGGAVNVTVDGAEAVSVVVTAATVPAATDPSYCAVYAIAKPRVQDAATPTGIFLLSRATSPRTCEVDGVEVAITDGPSAMPLVDGRATLNILQGSVVSLLLQTDGGNAERRNVVIPSNAGPVNFFDLES